MITFPLYDSVYASEELGLISLEEWVDCHKTVDPNLPKLKLPASLIQATERNGEYACRTGYTCPEIDTIKYLPKVAYNTALAALRRASIVAAVTTSAGGGIHPVVQVVATGSFQSDFDLAASVIQVVSGGYAIDDQMSSPKQLLFIAADKDAHYRPDHLIVEPNDGWADALKRLQELDPDEEPDCFKAASLYKTYETRLNSVFDGRASFIAFCARSSEFGGEDWCNDKYARAQVYQLPNSDKLTRSARAAQSVSDIVRANIELSRIEIKAEDSWREPNMWDEAIIRNKVFERTNMEMSRDDFTNFPSAVGLFHRVYPLRDYIEACNTRYEFTSPEAARDRLFEILRPVVGYGCSDFEREVISRWPGHLVGNFYDNEPCVYALLLYGEQRIGKDLFLMSLLPQHLRGYYTNTSLGSPRDMAAAARGRMLVVLSEGGFTAGRAPTTNAIKALITNMPSSRRLFSNFNDEAPNKFMFVFTMNDTEFALLDRAQLASRIMPVEMKPEEVCFGGRMADYIDGIREEFWAAALASSEPTGKMPRSIIEGSYHQFPADAETLPEMVLRYCESIEVGERYSIRELVFETDPGRTRVTHSETAAVRAALLKNGWVRQTNGTVLKEVDTSESNNFNLENAG